MGRKNEFDFGHFRDTCDILMKKSQEAARWVGMCTEKRSKLDLKI